MSYIEKAFDLLSNINSESFYRNQIKQKYEKQLKMAKDGGAIVLHGYSPYAKEILPIIQQNYPSKIYLVDKEDFDDVKSQNNTIFCNEEFINSCNNDMLHISCSSINLGRYIKLLVDKGITNIIPYHALPFIDNIFDGHKKTYSIKNSLAGISNIINNKEKYADMLNGMEDDISKEILAKIIVYRMTMDIHATYDVLTLESGEYFNHSFLEKAQDEIFVDGGGYNGDTYQSFVKAYNDSYNKYYFFEPETASFNCAKQHINDERVTFYNVGLYDEDTQVSFMPYGFGISAIDEAGCEKVSVIALDHLVDKPVTLYKLDVEGAEQKALIGSCNIIKQYKPKLIISIYHKPGDIVDLYNYIKTLRTDYKFYIRCSWESVCSDVVLYAI